MKKISWYDLLIILIIAVFSNLFPQNGEASFLVATYHPRILITPADVEFLKNKCSNITPYKEIYRSLKARVDGWSMPTGNRYIIGYQIQALVFVSLIENYNKNYLNKVDQWITNLFVKQKAINLTQLGDAGAKWGSADIILGVAMAYDWLYPTLPSTKRRQYGKYLRDFQQAIIDQKGGITRHGARSDYSNQFFYFDGMLAITGIALYNEGIDDELAMIYLKTFEKYLLNNMLSTVNQVGGSNGGWHEGLGYADRAMTYFTLQLEAWRVATGKDLFSQAEGLKGLNQWLFYCTQPDGKVVNIGDVSGGSFSWGAGEGRRASILGARFKDGFSQYIANRVDPINSSNWPYVVFYLLWYDSNIAEINLSKVSLDKHFDGIGWVSMRNKWDSSSTFAMFYSGNYYFGHQHYDQNSFIIFKNAPLAIDNGIYGVGPPSLKTATRFHNTILVGDPGAEGDRDDGEAGQSGASPMNYIEDPENSSSNKGKIILFDDDPNFVYTIGNASKAYNKARVLSYIRKFLYIKPDYFVVLDRVVIPATTYPIRWLIQSENIPEISGTEIRITNGSGRLFNKTLLPNNVNISVNKIFSGMKEYGDGNYRVEIVPSLTKCEDNFLNILWATDHQVTTRPSSVLIISSSGNMVGAQFSRFVVLLSRNGTIDAQEKYIVSTSGPLKHFLGDLISNGIYNIYQDGTFILSKAASKGGILQFSSIGGGKFKVKFTGDKLKIMG